MSKGASLLRRSPLEHQLGGFFHSHPIGVRMTSNKNSRTFKSFIAQVIVPLVQGDDIDEMVKQSDNTAGKAKVAGALATICKKATVGFEQKAKEAHAIGFHLAQLQASLTALSTEAKAEAANCRAANEYVGDERPNPWVPQIVKDSYILAVEGGTPFFYGPFTRDGACAVINSRKGLNWDLVGSTPAGRTIHGPGSLDPTNVDKIAPRKRVAKK